MRSPLRCIATALAAALLAGCSPSARRDSAGGGAAGGKLRLEFWHTRRGSQEDVLKSICDEYNRSSADSEILPVYQGGYDDLNKKIRASILGRSLPALAVAYESHVSEYMANQVIRPLDDLVRDPEVGLSPQELADIPEQYLESNRFAAFGNRLLSFPFTKSNLVFYFNRTLLAKAGLSTPPETWDQFESQARKLTAIIGKPAYAFDVDASTLDGLIYSYGGELLKPDGTTRFDEPPTVAMLSMLQRMAAARTLAEVAPDDIPSLFSGQMCAFSLGTSSGRAGMEELIGGQFDWDVAVIPHAAGVEPVTVMYGPNVCIFKAAPAQERAAWKFVKYFISPPVTARWARETGYLPVRRSAVELPEMKEFYAKNPRARHIYETLPLARGEPNVLGWQEVRKHLEDAARSVIDQGTPPQAAAAALKKKADATLAASG